MKHGIARAALALLLGIVLLGCEPTQPVASSGPPAPPPPPGSAPPPPPAGGSQPPAAASNQAPLPVESKVGVFAGSIDDLAARPGTAAAPPPPVTSEAPAAEEPATERVKAEKGVGLKGRSLDQYEGIVVTPAKAYFSAKERIAFEIQVPHALQLYEASNGEAPKTETEFFDNVIKANQIKLPVLPPGAKYVYDVETKQLMVERPKKQ
jgi:hypothetical protein